MQTDTRMNTALFVVLFSIDQVVLQMGKLEGWAKPFTTDSNDYHGHLFFTYTKLLQHLYTG